MSTVCIVDFFGHLSLTMYVCVFFFMWKGYGGNGTKFRHCRGRRGCPPLPSQMAISPAPCVPNSRACHGRTRPHSRLNSPCRYSPPRCTFFCRIDRLAKEFGYTCVVMVGDGATDMQVSFRFLFVHKRACDVFFFVSFGRYRLWYTRSHYSRSLDVSVVVRSKRKLLIVTSY